MTRDHLGSPRVITDQNGAVTNRKDYTAFGEVNYTSQRVTSLGYDSFAEETRKGYTGYEKDAESGLDFAQARYYNSVHGRFTSVDPLTASASIRNPQTFNRYSYVLNSPYKYVDPLGLLSVTTGACGSACPGSAGVSFGLIGLYSDNGGPGIQGWDSQQVDGSQAMDPESLCDPEFDDRARAEATSQKQEQPQNLPDAISPDDPQVVSDNAALTRLFTSGPGLVVTNRPGRDPFYGEGSSTHYRYQNGQIITIHVNAGESGTQDADVFLPPGFKPTYNNGKSNTVSAYNNKTREFILYLHMSGVSSQAELNRNQRTKNKAGWSLIGKTGGPGGNDPGRRHACIKIYSSPANHTKAQNQYNPNKVGTGAVERALFGDFRRFIK